MDYLSLKNVTKKFGREKTFALNQVSFDATKSEIVGIIGSSGSGKTTLLRIISGLEIPHSGKIVLNDNILNDTSVFVAPENRNCTLVFQDYALFPHLNVKQNIEFSGNLNWVLFQKLTIQLDLLKLLSKYPHELSGGQKQRVSLARALFSEPKILLIDEPISNQDKDNKIKIIEIVSRYITETDFRKERSKEVICILVSHEDINDYIQVETKSYKLS